MCLIESQRYGGISSPDKEDLRNIGDDAGMRSTIRNDVASVGAVTALCLQMP